MPIYHFIFDSILYRITLLLFFLSFINIQSQDNPSPAPNQLTPFLERTYYSINLGAVFYPFSGANLNDGYYAESRKKNVFSGRFLLGYNLNRNLDVQFGVMRPASWYQYLNVNGEVNKKSVWINLWSLSLKRSFRIKERFRLYGEFGFGNLTRVGFTLDSQEVYPDAHYLSFVTGMGLQYNLNHKWDLLLNALYIPKSVKQNQPYIFQSTVGMQYNLSQDAIEETSPKANEDYQYFFPRRLLQLGYGTSKIGFFANEFFSLNANIGKLENVGIPIFWNGDVQAAETISLTYMQTAYHGRKLFSLDWGASVTSIRTVDLRTHVMAFSLFPVLRFYVMRNKHLDLYLDYSVIGPTYLTRRDIDGINTGPNFTYQDFMGFGFFFGKNRSLNFDMRIMHYSNGNIFNNNAGVAIPIVFSIGKTL